MKYKIFRDPIYDLIKFDCEDDKLILKIIDSKEFQRLRRIKQLGLANYTYSSAVHDRFSHSIGVANLAGIMIDNLELPSDEIHVSYVKPVNENKGERIKLKLTKKEIKQLVQVAALLHDIGHGPFSHAFERAIKEGGNYKSNVQMHENIGIKIILDGNISSISKLLDQYENDVFKGALKYLVRDIINGDLEPKWIKELISSQFDCDRMDYLLRDAYMCGVKYAYFDWKWIFQNIKIKEVPIIKYKNVNNHDKYRLVIDGSKGIYSLESFIISRYHMYEQVYNHKTTQSFESIIKNIFNRLLYLKKTTENFNEIVPFTQDYLVKFLDNPNDLESFLKLDDVFLFNQFVHWQDCCQDRILKKLCARIVNRKSFKLFKEYSDTIKENSEIESFAQEELCHKILDNDDNNNIEYFTTIDRRSNTIHKIDESQIFIQLKDEIKPLNQCSIIIKNIESKTSVCRTFYDKDELNLNNNY